MKRFFGWFLVLVLFLLLCAFVPVNNVKSMDCLPPGLPSSFWGTTSGIKAGQVITISDNNQVVATTKAFTWGKQVVYSVNVRAYDACSTAPGGREGDQLVFRTDYRHIIARAQWRGGTNSFLTLVQK